MSIGRIVPDTAGPGRHRGGASMLRDSLWLRDAQHHLMSLRYKHPPGFGAHGGGSGAPGGIWIFDGEGRPPALSRSGPGSYAGATPVGGVLDPQTFEPSRDGVYHYPFRVPFWETGPDAVLRYVNCAGGGWGDPLERDPEAVKRDVRDGYVTIAGAARESSTSPSGSSSGSPLITTP